MLSFCNTFMERLSYFHHTPANEVTYTLHQRQHLSSCCSGEATV